MGDVSQQQQQQQKNNTNNLEVTDAHFLQSRLHELERRDKDKDEYALRCGSPAGAIREGNAKLKWEAKDATAGGGQSGRIAIAHGHQQQSEVAIATTSYANTSAAHHVAAQKSERCERG